MHKARLTQKITKRRCEYLEHQWEMGRLSNENQIVGKIKAALPARENEIAELKSSFLEYMQNNRDAIACERCGLLTSCWDYYGEEQLCMDCYEELNEEN